MRCTGLPYPRLPAVRGHLARRTSRPTSGASLRHHVANHHRPGSPVARLPNTTRQGPSVAGVLCAPGGAAPLGPCRLDKTEYTSVTPPVQELIHCQYSFSRFCVDCYRIDSWMCWMHRPPACPRQKGHIRPVCGALAGLALFDVAFYVRPHPALYGPEIGVAGMVTGNGSARLPGSGHRPVRT